MKTALIPAPPIQSLFDSFVNEAFSGAARNAASWQPAVDLLEDSESYRLTVELPGLRQDEIEILMEDRLLTIRAQRQLELKDGAQYRLNERRHGRFERSFRLPTSVDPSAVDAALDHGVLSLMLPKKPETKSRTIEIRTPTETTE